MKKKNVVTPIQGHFILFSCHWFMTQQYKTICTKNQHEDFGDTNLWQYTQLNSKFHINCEKCSLQDKQSSTSYNINQKFT